MLTPSASSLPADPTERAGSPAAEREIWLMRERLRLLHDGLPLSLLVNAMLASLLLAVQWPVVDTRTGTAWLSLMGVGIILRALEHRAYCQAREADRLDARRALWRYRAGALGTALLWGLASILMFPAEPLEHRFFLAFVVGGVSAGGITALAADRTAAAGFVTLALLPMALRFALSGSGMDRVIALMVLVFWSFLLATANRMFRQLDQVRELRAAVARQARDLDRQRRLNDLIARAQLDFARSPGDSTAFATLLSGIMELTSSGCGFIAVIQPDPGGNRLQTLAASRLPEGEPAAGRAGSGDAAGDAAFSRVLAELEQGRRPVVRNAPITAVSPVLSVKGPVRLRNFLGLPVLHGRRLVAVIGLGDRRGGWGVEDVEALTPLLTALGHAFERRRPPP